MFNFVKLLLTEEPWDDEPIAIQIVFIEKNFNGKICLLCIKCTIE